MTGIIISILLYLIVCLIPIHQHRHRLSCSIMLVLIILSYAALDPSFMQQPIPKEKWNHIFWIWSMCMVLFLTGKPFLAATRRLRERLHTRKEAAALYREEESRALYYARRGFDEIDHLDGCEFEKFCAYLLRNNNYEDVEITRGSGDQGVDIIAWYGNEKYAIQCKRFHSRLGNTPVQEVHAGKAIYSCDRAAVMTNSYFTPGAVQAAESCDVELWDRDDLCAMIDACGR